MELTHTDLNTTLAQAQSCIKNGHFQQALQLMQTAVDLAPEQAAAWVGLGVALRFTGHIDAAAEAFKQALVVQPDKADAQVYLAMIRLSQGRQHEGWPLYQARWRNPYWTDKLRYPQQSLWQGQVRPGLRLLLWGEQGFGDVIQFARYAPWLMKILRKQGAHLQFEVAAPLYQLFVNSWSFMPICRVGESHGQFDAHVPLLDLPHLWGDLVGTEGLPYLPTPLPYLSALPDLWAQQRGVTHMATTQPALRVGLCWQGRPTHPDDKIRSIAPEQLTPFSALPGICWINLQKQGAPLSWLNDDLQHCQDFADTARIVASLDLVICIDSAVAHLAGALGKPVWLLLPYVADWRWQQSGTTTPWYPNMRLFRQRRIENWSHVIARVAEALINRSTHAAN